MGGEVLAQRGCEVVASARRGDTGAVGAGGPCVGLVLETGHVLGAGCKLEPTSGASPCRQEWAQRAPWPFMNL